MDHVECEKSVKCFSKDINPLLTEIVCYYYYFISCKLGVTK